MPEQFPHLIVCALYLFESDWSTARDKNCYSFHLPTKTKYLVSLAYSLHLQKPTGNDYFRATHREDAIVYHSNLYRVVTAYVKNDNAKIFEGSQRADELDRPITHPVLQLRVQTIPIFDHNHNVSALVLESVYRR